MIITPPAPAVIPTMAPAPKPVDPVISSPSIAPVDLGCNRVGENVLVGIGVTDGAGDDVGTGVGE